MTDHDFMVRLAECLLGLPHSDESMMLPLDVSPQALTKLFHGACVNATNPDDLQTAERKA